MPFSEAAVIAGAMASSALGVLLAAVAATAARRAANVAGMLAGVVMFGVAVGHLAPQALGDGNWAWLALAAGAILGALFEAAARMGEPERRTGALHLGSLLALIVLAVHSTLDGAVYSTAFAHSEGSGLLASLGLLIHEGPEGVVAMMLGLQAGLGTRLSLLAAVLASTLSTPLGLVLADNIGKALRGGEQLLFAGSAGLLLFVGFRLVAEGWRSIRSAAGAS